MTSKAPPIPPAQRPHWGGQPQAEAHEDVSHAPGGPTEGGNRKNQGRAANRRQNVDAVHRKVQDR